METLTLLHTNDLHSHFENWPKIRRFLRGTKAQEEQLGHSVLTFDDGDAMDRVHPLSEATDGKANIALMNQVAYDAVTIGNNEGVGNSHDQLEALYAQAHFPVVLGNLFEQDGSLAAFAKRSLILTTHGGTRVAVLGFTAPFFLTYTPNGWQVKPVAAVLPELLEALKGQYDVLVVLSHLGLPTDRYLAANFPQIDVVIGGHTHHLLVKGELDGRTLLTAAGKHGQYVGQITLKLDDAHHIAAKKAVTFKTEDLLAEPEDQAEITGLYAKGQTMLAQTPVANIPHAFPIDYNGPSPLLSLGLEMLAARGHTKAAMLNAGLFLTPLEKGIVTKADLHQMLPHAMHLMKTTLSGVDLWRLVMEIQKNRAFLKHFHLVGMSFRGDIFGDIELRHLTVGPKRSVDYGGKALMPDQDYVITGLDHYLFIPFFPTIDLVDDNELLFPTLLRDAFGQYLAEKFPL